MNRGLVQMDPKLNRDSTSPAWTEGKGRNKRCRDKEKKGRAAGRRGKGRKATARTELPCSAQLSSQAASLGWDIANDMARGSSSTGVRRDAEHHKQLGRVQR